jgi:hypothetical protein
MSSFVDGSRYRRKTVEVCLTRQCGMAAIDGSDRRMSSIFGDIAARMRKRELSTSLGAVGVRLMGVCRFGRRNAMTLSAQKLRAIVNLLSDPGSAANAASILAREAQGRGLLVSDLVAQTVGPTSSTSSPASQPTPKPSWQDVDDEDDDGPYTKRIDADHTDGIRPGDRRSARSCAS